MPFLATSAPTDLTGIISAPSPFHQSFITASHRRMPCHKLGSLLISAGILTREEIDAALQYQKQTGEPLGKLLIRLGVVSATYIYRILRQQWCLKATATGVALMMVTAPPAQGADEKGALVPQFQMAAAAINPSVYRPLSQLKTNTGRVYPALFRTREIRSEDISAFKKWTAVITRFENEMRQPIASSPRILMWRAELRRLKDLPVHQQIEEINTFLNQVRYIEDQKNYGKSDYWSTPIEFFTHGGDCEDYAIAKYASLRALGFSSDQLRIVVVQDRLKNLTHAVLAVYTEDGILILDNQNLKVENAAQISRYQPIFSINSDSWWLHRRV